MTPKEVGMADGGVTDTECQETEQQKMERGRVLFSEGKRALMAGTFAEANEKLSEACTIYTEVHDQFAPECFDPHYFYGKALLEVSRLETGVFSNALQGVDVEEEEEESAEDGEEEEAGPEGNDLGETPQENQFEDADQLTDEQRAEIHEQVEEALEENAEALDKGQLPPEDPTQASSTDTKDTPSGETESEAVEEKKEEEEKQEEEEGKDKEMKEGEEKEGEEEEKGENEEKREEENGEEEKEEEKQEEEEGTDKEMKEGEEKEEEKEGEDEEKGEEENGGEGGNGEEEAMDEGVEAGEEEAGGSGEDGDPATIPHLQLAWEVLETARSICDKQEKTSEWQEKKADTLLLLGDVSIEDENYKQALDDLALCLDIQQTVFPSKNDRRIAETLFQMGRAHNLSDNFESAADHFQKACDVIKNRTEDTRQQLEKVGEGEAEEKSRLETELKELTQLLPDIERKVEDARESAKQAVLMQEQKKDDDGSKGDDIQTDKAAPTDITSLVRKPLKRSGGGEGDTVDGGEQAKRVKCADDDTSDTTNGHSVSQSNGAEKPTAAGEA